MIKTLQKLASAPVQFTVGCLMAFFLLHAVFLFIEILPKNIRARSELALAIYVEPLHKTYYPIIQEPLLPYRHALNKEISEYARRGFEKTFEPTLMWWRVLPIYEPIATARPREPKIFWRGEIAAYVKKTHPLQMPEDTIKQSAYTIRYALQVDLRQGRLLYLKPLDEELASDFSKELRDWIWNHPFESSVNGGIISGELELCFGGEYAM